MTPEGAGIVLRMYEGALRSVDARAAWCRECVEAAGMTMEAWRALPVAESYPWPEGTREHVIAKGKKIVQRAERRGAVMARVPMWDMPDAVPVEVTAGRYAALGGVVFPGALGTQVRPSVALRLPGGQALTVQLLASSLRPLGDGEMLDTCQDDAVRVYPTTAAWRTLYAPAGKPDFNDAELPHTQLCYQCGEPAAATCAACDRPLCEEHGRTTAVPGDTFCHPRAPGDSRCPESS